MCYVLLVQMHVILDLISEILRDMCLNNRITCFQMTQNERNLIQDYRSVLIRFFEFDKNDQYILLPVCRTRWSDSITIKKERNEYS